MTQKTKAAKSKPKNAAKTEKITVADKMPTAGQHAVPFRSLAIIGIATACGLSVCARRLCSSLHTYFALAHLLHRCGVFGTGLAPFSCTHTHTGGTFHPGHPDYASSNCRRAGPRRAGPHASTWRHGNQRPADVVQPKRDRPSSPGEEQRLSVAVVATSPGIKRGSAAATAAAAARVRTGLTAAAAVAAEAVAVAVAIARRVPGQGP